MLAALLPLLEALGAEGGAAAAIGGAGSEAGLMGGLGRLLSGGTRAFGSQAELGSALRKISDLQSGIQASQQALESKRQQQEQLAHKAREDERQYAFSDPGHQAQMVELARQQQQHQKEIRRQQTEMTTLRARANVTTDPAAARAANFAQMATTAGLIGTAASIFPQRRDPDKLSPLDYANPLKVMGHFWNKAQQGAANIGQSGANVGSFVAGDVNTQIAGQGMQSFKQIFDDLRKMKPTALLRDVSELPAKIKGWSEALVESQRSISRFNGSLAIAFAQQERRGVLRAIASGERTGGATSDLSNNLQSLYDQLQPMKDAVTIVVANGLNRGVTILSSILLAAQQTYTTLHVLVEKVPLLNVALAGLDAKLKDIAEQAKGKGSAPLQRTFNEVLRHDPKIARMGVPRR